MSASAPTAAELARAGVFAKAAWDAMLTVSLPTDGLLVPVLALCQIANTIVVDAARQDIDGPMTEASILALLRLAFETREDAA